MANSLLHSIGAQAAFRGRQVISMSGDGGFTMMMGEFLTLVQTGLPVKVVVLNNGTLGFVEMEMKASGFLDTGCDLRNPNFAAMANAIGIKGVRVEHSAELEDALSEAFTRSGPALVDVVSARQEFVMPPATTGDQAYHFELFMLRAVMDVHVREVCQLGNPGLRGWITEQLVGDDLARHRARAKHAPEESFGGGRVAPLLQQDIEFGAVLVDGPPQHIRFTAQRHEQLTKMRCIARFSPESLGPMREPGGKFIAPASHGFITHHDAALEQQLFNVSQAQPKPKVPANATTDDRR